MFRLLHLYKNVFFSTPFIYMGFTYMKDIMHIVLIQVNTLTSHSIHFISARLCGIIYCNSFCILLFLLFYCNSWHHVRRKDEKSKVTKQFLKGTILTCIILFFCSFQPTFKDDELQ